MRLFDQRTVRVLFTALVFCLGLLFLYAAWRAFIAFLFAIFFAYLLEAPVSRLQVWFRGSRKAAIAVVYVIFFSLLVLVFALAGPPVAQEAQKLTQQAPELAKRFDKGEFTKQVGLQHGWSAETIDRINGLWLNHRQQVIGGIQALVVRAARTVQNMWWLFLAPILAVFFLKDGQQLGETIINSVKNPRNRQLLAQTVDEMNSMLAHFIRAQLLMSAIAIVVVTLVIWAMRVPYALALGPAAGALEFIPVVGPVVGAVVILGVGFISGYNHLLWVLLFLVIWRGIQDYVTAPRILGSKLELHPLAILFGVLAGGEVAGVLGVFLSIPVLATVRILWRAWRLYRSSSLAPKELQHAELP
ncbi:MAG TPA: AI-2E family transporter [Candidatus Solibacter sp.]|nr:AI-2E family transporter [Candidatus Solibacter sp.]